MNPTDWSVVEPEPQDYTDGTKNLAGCWIVATAAVLLSLAVLACVGVAAYVWSE